MRRRRKGIMSELHKHLHGETGFSLVELIVIIAIISTLLGLATLAFHDWLVKNNVEAQTRQMATDFSELRVRAMTTKQRHSITVNPGEYVFKSYSSADEPASAGTELPGGTHKVTYQLKKNATTLVAGEIYDIDQRGMIDPGSFAGNVIPSIYLAHTGTANYDCLNLCVVRVNAGKTNATGDNCDER